MTQEWRNRVFSKSSAYCRERMPEELNRFQFPDGCSTYYREWKPEGEDSKAIVVCLHGIQSHSGWFVDSCAAFARNGYHVYSPDRRGSGLMGYELSDSGQRGHVDSHRVLINDLKAFIDFAKADDPAKKTHLIGISWGGKLATCFSLLAPHMVDSLVLVAPGLKSKVGFPLKEKMKIFLSSLFTKHRPFRIPIGRADMFTSNPEKIRFIEEDNLSLQYCTARFFVESVKMDRLIQRRLSDVRLPVMLLLAGNDPIVDNDGVRAMFDRFSSEVKELRIYEHAWHTLEFEEDNSFLIHEVIEWMQEQGGPSPRDRRPQ